MDVLLVDAENDHVMLFVMVIKRSSLTTFAAPFKPHAPPK
jgi:hypothetical protein